MAIPLTLHFLWFASVIHAEPAADRASDNVPVCTAGGGQTSPAIVSDGRGGAIVAWVDQRIDGGGDLYAQRLDALGRAQWSQDGVPVCTAASSQSLPSLVSDGVGGAIIVWMDARKGDSDIYAQRVSADGRTLWSTDGEALCTATGDQFYPVIVSDGAGGAIAAWEDLRNSVTTANDIYAQRIEVDGTLAWQNNGVPICTAPGPQHNPIIASDGFGGAVVVWQTVAQLVEWPTAAQRVDAQGVVRWTPNGIGLRGGSAVVPDGGGGVILAWQEFFDDFASGILLQRLSAEGQALWADGVMIVDTSVPIGETPDGNPPQLVSDGSGGAIVVWPVKGHGYAQRVDQDAAVKWTPGGVPICGVALIWDRQTILADGSGGLIAFWAGVLPGTLYPNLTDLYGQGLTAEGACRWGSDGVAVSLAPGGQSVPVAIADESGATLAWYDTRNQVDEDIYTQRVDRSGHLRWPRGRPASSPTAASQVPARLQLRLRLGSSYSSRGMAELEFTLPQEGLVGIDIYDLAGRRVKKLAEGNFGTGAHRTAWDGTDASGNRVAPGVYFARATLGQASTSVILLRPH